MILRMIFHRDSWLKVERFNCTLLMQLTRGLSSVGRASFMVDPLTLVRGRSKSICQQFVGKPRHSLAAGLVLLCNAYLANDI